MARSLVLCITSICFPIVCFFHFLTYSLIYSLIFGTDLTLVHDIGTILKINKKGKIKETSLERLRSAFVMATGRVFSNLKYMQMPRYLESQQYEELITENEHLHGIQKQFESSIVKQKIPIQFILNKPNISGFLIAYILNNRFDLTDQLVHPYGARPSAVPGFHFPHDRRTSKHTQRLGCVTVRVRCHVNRYAVQRGQRLA